MLNQMNLHAFFEADGNSELEVWNECDKKGKLVCGKIIKWTENIPIAHCFHRAAHAGRGRVVWFTTKLLSPQTNSSKWLHPKMTLMSFQPCMILFCSVKHIHRKEKIFNCYASSVIQRQFWWLSPRKSYKFGVTRRSVNATVSSFLVELLHEWNHQN